MVRTQIQLDEAQYRYLKERSRATGMSLAAIIRQAVDQLRCSEAPLRERALQLVGAFEADVDDLSVRHDDYFADSASE